MLTGQQIEAVQDSFARVVPVADPFMMMFYDKLFEIAPHTRALFPEDMEEQRAKAVSTLATVVQSLDNLEPLLPDIVALGQRHAGYNVKASDYGPVGDALVWALEACLRGNWTTEVETAWKTAYATLAKVMIDAASTSEPMRA